MNGHQAQHEDTARETALELWGCLLSDLYRPPEEKIRREIRIERKKKEKRRRDK